ncbi:proline iminopeptidase-family hydrolase [Fulvivirga sedimenti]|uniref:Proline iminopeptidase-family hydrolase n=1 Tax=Fulvivirga sedimenti TaxID=2879465 RepID=A0A9X1KYE1_9BACT|nr:proline iminopeptidase-family hydrolase [Fulvivirga sedimenti]MCA6075107.1 proline iminopeptidase-family hydrolase [Fulvivirga sedimenti]MCA6076284.1 proline iminopeptidase-family hydrolase [Fulvivirga sedimenti]MCA6077412.1 proline iminopeptidase-family hydrolase [Fulvivirga sedimenti]
MTKRNHYLIPFALALLTLILVAGCQPKESTNTLQAGEGFAEVEGGKIWYKVSGSGDAVPLVLLHGGPGVGSIYLKPFEDLSSDRPVIRYDQLGCGKSDYISDTTLFTVDRFVGELEALRNHLGISKWHIMGHSWGTMLAAAYYEAHQDAVASLTFASPCLVSQDWMSSTRELLESFPDSLKQAINEAEISGDFSNPGYETAMNMFYENYVWGANPPAADFDSTITTMNNEIYGYMWGASEFNVTGTLETFDATETLKKINVPTLFTAGEFDEIKESYVRKWADMVPGSKVEIIDNAVHLTTWGNPEKTIAVQRTFLNQLEE